MEKVIKVSDITSNIDNYDVQTHNAVIIPPEATNGDMMKEIFPNITVKGIDGDDYIAISIGMGTNYFALDWWDASYSSESEV